MVVRWRGKTKVAQAQVKSTEASAHSAEQVWTLLRGFLWDWHPAIATMQAQRSDQGALIRAFKVQSEDRLYREQLTYFSDSARRLSYRHLEGIAGAQRYEAQVSVTPTDTGCCIEMRADIWATGTRANEIAEGTQVIFDSTIAALDMAVATVPARVTVPSVAPQTNIQHHTSEGAPRLALTTTPSQRGSLCLFLHGIGGARSNWKNQLPVTATHMRAAALDLRGYGDSALGPDQSTVDDYCNDILRVMAEFGTDKLVLCGLSYGAWIATSFAMRHPDKLAGLILSGGCTGMSEASEAARDGFRNAREGPLDAGQTPADFAPEVVGMLCAPGATDAVREELRVSMAQIPVATYRDALGCFTNPQEVFDFSKLTMPILMITGEHDRLAPPSEISQVAERIHNGAALPDVRFEVLRGAGHVCNVEDPAAYNALLADFLERVAM
jgi:pimeloyl-ACP methyl ester carboxylesterase